MARRLKMNRRTVQSALFGLLGLLCLPAVTVRPQIVVQDATEVERQLSIRAFEAVKQYYRELGYTVAEDAAPTIVFQDRISLEGRNVPDALGLFDPDSMRIHLVHFESQKFQDRGFLGAPATEDVCHSIIVHECSHYLNALVSPGLLPPEDELIACTVQLDLMDVP
jgi:hypothetical protein